MVDQAYVAFTTEDLLKPADVKNNPNLVIIQSISKAYNIPGLRIGYLIAQPDITERINKYLIPWSINAFAIEASKYILIHPAQFILCDLCRVRYICISLTYCICMFRIV